MHLWRALKPQDQVIGSEACWVDIGAARGRVEMWVAPISRMEDIRASIRCKAFVEAIGYTSGGFGSQKLSVLLAGGSAQSDFTDGVRYYHLFFYDYLNLKIKISIIKQPSAIVKILRIPFSSQFRFSFFHPHFNF